MPLLEGHFHHLLTQMYAYIVSVLYNNNFGIGHLKEGSWGPLFVQVQSKDYLHHTLAREVIFNLS